MNNEEFIFELESIITLWQKDYKLAGTTNRITSVIRAIEVLKKEKDEVV